MNKIVVDASVMICILFKDEENKYSKSFLDCIMNGTQVVVPEIFHAEILNVLIVSERRGRLDNGNIQKILRFLLDLNFLTITHLDKENILELELAKKYNLTSYDAIYLSLAKREGLQLATLDKKLGKASVSESVFWSDKIIS